MKRIALISALAAVAAVGCKKKDAGDKPAEPSKPTTAAPAKAATPPTPYTGALTIERVLGIDGKLSRQDGNIAWADGLAIAEAQLGKATKVDGNKYQWAVIEGDDCAYFEMEKDDGAKYGASGEIVGMIQTPMKVAKDGPAMNRAECRKVAGIEPGPPEDPDAAGPPTDGSLVTLDAFRGLLPARSKWKGQVVKLRAHVAGVSTSTSGSDKWITVQLKASADDKGDSVICSFAATDDGPALGAEVIATGTVEIAEMMSMGSGDVTLEPKLADCALEAAPATKGKPKTR